MAQSVDAANEVAWHLRGGNLFRGLPEHELRRLAGIAELRMYRRAQYVVRAGEGGNALFLVAHGDVTLGRDTVEGHSVPLMTYARGDICGVALRSPTVAHLSHVSIMSSTALLVRVPMTEVDRLRDELPDFRRQYDALLLERLATAFERIAGLVSLSADERLALHLAARARAHENHMIPGTHEHLAAWIGVTRTHVSKLLGPLFARRVIEHPAQGRGIVVPDPRALDGR